MKGKGNQGSQQSIVASPQGGPSPAGTTKEPGKNWTGLVVIVVVLALAVAGVAGWVFWPRSGPEPSQAGQPTGAPPAQTGAAASLVKVPFDVTSGLPKPNDIEVMGVWSQVVVFLLDYRESMDTIVFRGVSVGTGEVLWTYDKTSDGDPLLAGEEILSLEDEFVTDGNLVLAIQKPGSGSDPYDWESYCPGETYLLILSAANGEGLTGGSIDPQCSLRGAGKTYLIVEPITYREGIVVVDLYELYRSDSESGKKQLHTVAYRDTDLDHPLWQVTGGDFECCLGRGSDPVIFSDLVRTLSGTYVSIHDGSPSGFVMVDDNRTVIESFWQTKEVVFSAVGAYSEPRFEFTATVLKGYSSPDAANPSWQHATLAHWFTSSSNLTRCITSQAFLGTPYSQDWEPGRTVEVAAISLVDGQQMWSTSLVTPMDYCTVLQTGDQELVALATETTLILVDGASGEEYARMDAAMQADNWNVEIHGCGQSAVCLVDTDQLTIKAIDYSSPNLPVLWQEPIPASTGAPEVFTTADGVVVVSMTTSNSWLSVVS